jgi:signal transduction histidine kinase
MIVFRRRLFWKVYLTLLASLVAVAVFMGAFWWLVGEAPRDRGGSFRIRVSDQLVPERDSPPGAIAAAITRLSDETDADISVYDAQGTLTGSRGAPILLAASERERVGMGPRIIRIDLSDGRAVLARLRPLGPRLGLRFLSMLLIVAGGVALAAFPLTARLTRRLETLRSGVERWGGGALSLRLDDTGHDEVAVVAGAFNAAAARVEELLTSQKALLANASHELRSPLARLRIAVELWLAQPGAELRAEIVRDLAEIDELVEEILLASRLDYPGAALARGAPVDLLGLAAEEAARFEASVEGMPGGVKPVEIEGDAALLRRLIRNLLENAAKHGRPPIHIAVTHTADKARIVVSDHGPGIAACERERVFEPFYRPAGRSESSGGWGLGLSLVRQIAIRHGGTAFCVAEPGGGSRFVVELQRTAAFSLASRLP